MYFAMFSRLRKGRRGQQPCIFHCGRAFGKGEATKTLHLKVFPRLGKGRRGKTRCSLQGFYAFGKGEGATHVAFYCVFAHSEKGEGAKNLVLSIVLTHSERAKRPKTLHLKVFPRLGKGRRGKTRCILQNVCAFGMGEGANHVVFYSVLAPSERAKGPKGFPKAFQRLQSRPRFSKRFPKGFPKVF